MSLSFDPSIYERINERNQNRDDQARQSEAQAVSSIPQALLAYVQQQKQDQQQQRGNRLSDINTGIAIQNAGGDPNAGMAYLNGTAIKSPQDTQPSSMDQAVTPGPWSNPQPEGTPAASTGGSYSTPPTPLLKGSQGPQQMVGRGVLDHWDKTAPPHLQTKATLGDVFPKNNDYNTVLTQMQNGDMSGISSLTKQDQARMKEDPRYQAIVKPAKTQDVLNYKQFKLNFPDSKVAEAQFNDAYPNGYPREHASLMTGGMKTDQTLGLRENQQQDKLESQARQSVSQLRGDKSLSRAEEQRDSAITAYNRIKQIEQTGEPMNPIDYVDILGQVYKARTGSAPTNEILSVAKQETAKGNMGKWYTYFTGNQAPATTQQIQNSLKDMVGHMGEQADQLHEGYMKSHLIKPSGLDQDRWDAIVSTNRGMSFKDATGYSGQSNSHPQDSEAVQWARANPGDPRSEKILQLNGGQ